MVKRLWLWLNSLLNFFALLADGELKNYIYHLGRNVRLTVFYTKLKISRWIDEKIIDKDRKLKATVKGKAVVTGTALSYESCIEASNIRPHRFGDIDSFDQDSAPTITESSSKAQSIIHVVNFFLPDNVKSSLYRRSALALESIERFAAQHPQVKLVACVSKPFQKTGWNTVVMERNAKNVLGHAKDFLFLKDMFTEAAKFAKEGDYIVYSNFDCIISQNFYSNLLEEDASIIEYVRRNCESQKSLEDIYKNDSWPYVTGRDAFAFKKSTYESIEEYIPDFIIGEPHWDTALSGICQKLHKTKENLEDIYHIDHARTWDSNSLSIGGEYNNRLWLEARAYGLSDIDLLSVEKNKALVIYNHDLSKFRAKKFDRFLQRHLDYEIVFIDLLTKTKDVKQDILYVKYYPIMHNGKATRCIDQSVALKNIGMHLLSGFKKIKFISLKDVNKYDYKGEEHDSSTLSQFNNFENTEKNKNFTYINDEGLLQSCWA